ncbi:docking protein 3 [Elysia marginata]|uniref:Docking protein 3 n=1 Tax=Elysia marginata TaxID=1093978 RepID=A0AAV4HN62_9GAST|nr:docking protein 3 [Elysia marginata]
MLLFWQMPEILHLQEFRHLLADHKALENHWCILFYGVKTLAPRVDIYEKDPRSKRTNASCKKTIYIELASWRKIETLEPAFSFDVKNGKHQYTFYCNSDAERRQWLLCLCCVSEGLFASKHVVGVSNDGVVHTSSIASDESSMVIQNNVYGGLSEVQNFFVLADQTDGCYNLGLKGIFKLSIGQGVIKLSDPVSGATSATWNITELRTFGCSTQTMFIHAGSRSVTGEGKFTFRTPESSKIVGFIDRETEIIQDINIGALPTHSPSSLIGLPQPANNTNEKIAMSKNPVAKKNGSGYVNVQTKPSSPAVSNNFLQQLDNKLETKLPPTRTVSNNSSDLSNGKQDKKLLKKLKEEEKRKEKEEKRIKKQEAEEIKKQEREMKKQEREMKKQEKAMKKQTRKASHADSPPPDYFDSVYAEAEETSGKTQQAFQVSPEDDYAVAGDFTPRDQPVQREGTKTQIYLEPWGNNPLLSPPSISEHTMQSEDIEGIYAAPEKKNIARPKPPTQDSLSEDDGSSTYSGPPPAIIPPSWEEVANIYAHANQASNSATTDYGHVYGIGSASQQFVPRNEDGNNIYDNQ